MRIDFRALALGWLAAGASAPLAQCLEEAFYSHTSVGGQFLLSAQYGRSVALHGDTALVGAPEEWTGGSPTGMAHVWSKASGRWLLEASLVPSFQPSTDAGRSVALHGDVAVIGDPSAQVLPDSYGRLHVFERTPSGWQERAFFVPFEPYTSVGQTLAFDGEWLFAGSAGDSIAAPSTGAVFVWRMGADPSQWVYHGRLEASGLDAFDWFGSSLAFDGERLVVGAPNEELAGVRRGAAYVYEHGPSGWVEVDKLYGSTTGIDADLGAAVAVDGDRIAAGASQDSPFGTFSGTTTIWERSGSSWVEVAALQPPDALAYAGFGKALAFQGERLWIQGHQTYAYEREASGWAYAQQLQVDGVADGDGNAFALDAGRLLIGAWKSGFGSYPNGPGGAFLLSIDEASCASLWAGTGALSLADGGIQELHLNAGVEHAFEIYLLLGSASGFAPGLALGAGLNLPLNEDAYFAYSLANPGVAPLGHSLGSLNAEGRSSAEIVLLPGADPALAGLLLHHAFLTLDPGTGAPSFASSPEPLGLTL